MIPAGTITVGHNVASFRTRFHKCVRWTTRTDDRARLNAGGAVHDVGEHSRVRFQDRVDINVCSRRINNRHASAHPLLVDSALHLRAEGGQPCARSLQPPNKPRVREYAVAHALAGVRCVRHHVGQVHSPCEFSVPSPRGALAQEGGIKRVGGRVDFRDFKLFRACVTMFDHTDDRPNHRARYARNRWHQDAAVKTVTALSP